MVLNFFIFLLLRCSFSYKSSQNSCPLDEPEAAVHPQQALLQTKYHRKSLQVLSPGSEEGEDDIGKTASVDEEGYQADEYGIGNTASFDEEGYQAVAKLCCTLEMETYVRRVITYIGLELCHEWGLLGLVPWYSCEENAVLLQSERSLRAVQNFSTLADNLVASVPPAPCAFVAPVGECPSTYDDCHGIPNPQSHRRRNCGNPTTTQEASSTVAAFTINKTTTTEQPTTTEGTTESPTTTSSTTTTTTTAMTTRTTTTTRPTTTSLTSSTTQRAWWTTSTTTTTSTTATTTTTSTPPPPPPPRPARPHLPSVHCPQHSWRAQPQIDLSSSHLWQAPPSPEPVASPTLAPQSASHC
mmetsp:Transcript_82882/g.151692  ORF Transcript_82882/g.151692 Transcript_82882/m.151692 type:complete len:355 (-) Transcript_82882:230-1294(-)